MDKEVLIKEFSTALQNSRGVFFVGAGISKPSGFKSWMELLKTMEKDINIKIDPNDDLTEIAQYIVNENMGNKGRLLKAIEENFAVSDSSKINNYHKYLSQTNLSTIWTTNYDTMLEKSINQQVSVKRCDNDLLPSYRATTGIEIIKMHGCIESPSPENIVITKEDYEDYTVNHPLTIERLRNDLINKSFLFIGYSYRDPNIQNIMNEVRQLCKKKTTPHYIILEEERDERLKRLQDLWCKDLLRYGINAYVYKYGEHVELEEILKEISIKSRGNTVYVTGSHYDENPMVNILGEELAKIDEVILLSGHSDGVGKMVLQSFIEYGINNKMDIHNRLKMYPNPYANNEKWDNKDEYLEELKKFRADLIRRTQVVIMFDGGKGTNVEYQLALEFGSIIIPVITNKESGFIKDIINNSSIIDTIRIYDNDYARKLENEQETDVGDIITCVKRIMNLK